LESRSLAGGLLHPSVDLLQQPGHSGHQRGLNVFHVPCNRLDPTREIDLHAEIQTQVQHHAFEDVREWQVRKHHAALLDLEKLSRRQRIEGNVPMREHGALRLSGCAGSVDNRGERIGFNTSRNRLVPIGVLVIENFAAVLQLCISGDALRLSARLKHDHSKLWKLFQRALNALELANRGNEQEARIAVSQNIFDLMNWLRRIERNVDRAYRQNGVVGNCPKRPTFCEHRDGVALSYAHLVEGECEAPDSTKQLPAGHSHPLFVLPEAEHFGVRSLVGGTP